MTDSQLQLVSEARDFATDIFTNTEDTVRKQFEQKGLVWPAKFVYIRSFKYDS